MRNDPVISVVIPYSEEHTPPEMLEEAKASARAQAVPVDIIVIHDSEQRGPAWARNRGLERAETRYVAFLDADDLWKEDKLERQLDRMAETRAGVCVEGKPMSTEEYIEAVFVGSVHGITSSILLDTDRVDAKFEESLERLEDWLFTMEAASEAGVCLCADLIEVRKHDGGLSSRGSLGLVVSQLERYGELALERVPEARPHRDEFYRNYHFLRGRHLHAEGQYSEAIREFVSALGRELHYEPAGGLILAVGALLWSRLRRIGSGRPTETKE